MKLHISTCLWDSALKCDALWDKGSNFSFYFGYISNEEVETMSIIDLLTKSMNSIDLADQLRNDIVPGTEYPKGSMYNMSMFEVQR